MSRNSYGHMVIDYYVERLRAKREVRRAIFEGMKTREDALRYRDYVRATVATAFGSLPKRVPLNAEVTGTIQCDGYRIEKVKFQSRPEFWVTANLYIPDGLQGKAPAVLGLCGHANEGKASGTYQEFPIRLAFNGFVTLLMDPIHQGERKQYVNLGKPLGVMSNGLCQGHNVMGKQLDLLGDSFAAWRVWDARCALDYLLTRPEVDTTRVGLTGNSGGGTLTEWTFANDDRFTMVAPSCHVTSFLTNLENELPTDAEQCPWGVIGAGLEMVDLMIAQAPKPVRFLGQKYDFFERRGLIEACADLKKFYSLLGAEDEVDMVMGPTTHGYSWHQQEAMVEFFRRKAGIEGEAVKVQPKTLPESELNVTPEGSVIKAGSRPIYELLADCAASCRAARKVPSSTSNWQALLRDLLQLPTLRDVPHFRIPRAYSFADKLWSRYAVETEEHGIRAIMKKRLVHREYSATLDVEPEVHVFLPHISSEDEASDEWVRGLNDGAELYAIDVRGLGESTQEDERGGILQGYGTDYMMYCFGMMFGESYFGRRVYDILRTLDLLVSEGASKIHLHGQGQGAIMALFAGMLHGNVVSVEEHEGLETYESWITEGVSEWPSASGIRGVLRYFDLPDLRIALARALGERAN